MSRYIGIYVKTCDLCNWTKVQDPFILLSSHYTCPWCIPGFVWCLDYQCSLWISLG
jgi:hypothetical protein